MSRELIGRLEGPHASFLAEAGLLRVWAERPEELPRETDYYAGANAPSLQFVLRDVPCDGPDLFVSFDLRAAPMEGYPDDIARLLWVGTEPGARTVPDPEELWVAGRANSHMSWANPTWFTAGFYFRGINTPTVDLQFEIEGGELLWIKNLIVRAHPDAMVREFENGLVVANPSDNDYTFQLEALTPRKRYRRLIGSSKQDPLTNDGSPVQGPLTIGPRDGLFLVRIL
jgi:hypothetical protein